MDKYKSMIGSKFKYGNLEGVVTALRELDCGMVVADIGKGLTFNVEVLTNVNESGTMSLESFLEASEESNVENNTDTEQGD